MRADGPKDESGWRPGTLDRLRALARRLLIAIFGHGGEARAHSSYHRVLRTLGRFGPPEDETTRAVLGALASRSRTIIDVGANVGRYAWFLRQHARPEATLIALEPHPAAARLLRGAVGTQPGSMVLEIAAADSDGRAGLRVPRGSFGSPVPGLGWVQARDAGDPEADIEIQLRRIDGLMEDGSMTVVAPVFMKIDVEGSEGRVLRGAEGLLRRHRPIIYFECQAALLARQNETPEGVWEVLDRAGYRVFGNLKGAFVPVPGVEPEIVNYLAIPTELASHGRHTFDAEALTALLDEWAAEGRGA